jgi:DNA-nicking Smr family endonuclease
MNKYSEMNEQDQAKFRDWIKDVLQNETATLTFQKKDGTIRVMQASLRKDDLPEFEKKTERVRKENDEVLSVVDTELNEWRSFRYDSIQQIEFDLGK